ncbi:MAG: hypothetical protein IJ368_04580 [Oscillospiraceae bacterium]|nr:hypothetical protein [Oscillospiraceae bacterium]
MKRKKSTLILSAILCAVLLCSCSDSEDALPSLDNLSEGSAEATTGAVTEIKVITQTENAVESQTEKISYDDIKDSIEEQIKILEAYYESDVKNMTEVEGYTVENIGNAKIYDIDCNGNCMMIVHFSGSLDGWSGSIDMGYAIDANGQIQHEVLCVSNDAETVQKSISVLKYSNNDKFYIQQYEKGASPSEAYKYILDGEIKLSTYSELGYNSVNGYTVTSDSYEKLNYFLQNAMKEPIITRMDGEIEIYLPDYKNISDEGILVEAQLVLPSRSMYVEKLADKFRLAWFGRNNDAIFCIYKIENGEYIKVGETSESYFDIDDTESGEYCMTVTATDPIIKESDYSEIVVVEEFIDYTTYTAIDFIGVSFEDLFTFSQGNYTTDEQVTPRFRIENIPYEFYGEIVDYHGNFTAYDETIKIVKVEHGNRLTDTVIVDDNLFNNIQNDLNVNKCKIEPVFYEGGFNGTVHVTMNIDGGLQIIVPVRVEIEYPEEATSEEYEKFITNIKDQYTAENISIDEVRERVNGSISSCVVKTYDAIYSI